MSNRPLRTTGRLPDPGQKNPHSPDGLSRFLRARPWIVDSVLWALPVTFVGVLSAIAAAETNKLSSVPLPFHVLIALFQAGPLALRRVAPLFSSSLIAAGFLLSVFMMMGPNFAIIAVPLTVYSTTAWGTRAQGRIVLSLGIAGALLLGGWMYLIALQATIGPDSRPLETGEYLLLATVVALCTAIVFIAWLLGGVGYRRRREVEGVMERNRLLERERESETRLAADAERMRIAREMHDVIAHSLSVVVAQADGGRYAAKADPSAAIGVLETIAHTGREALAQTRSLLGFLRSDDDDSRSQAPLPGIADLESLIADVRSAGLPVSMKGVDSFGAGHLPDGASLAVYRIVQEALTNVLKHAGSTARAHVWLHAEDRELVIRISDDGGGMAPDPRALSDEAEHPAAERIRGNGIIGMKERAALYGGTLTARAIRSQGLPDTTDRNGSPQAHRTADVPGFTSGKVPGSAFGTATGFLVEARFPLARIASPTEAATDLAEPAIGPAPDDATDDSTGDDSSDAVSSDDAAFGQLSEADPTGRIRR